MNMMNMMSPGKRNEHDLFDMLVSAADLWAARHFHHAISPKVSMPLLVPGNPKTTFMRLDS